MISKISFGSTYKVSDVNNRKGKFEGFQLYAMNKEFTSGAKTQVISHLDKKSPSGCITTCTMVAPDSIDSDIEAYCATNGIKYKKLKKSYLLSEELIEKRIKEAPRGFRKENIKCEKLEHLIGKKNNNIVSLYKDWKQSYGKNLDFKLLTGDDFYATTLQIKPTKSSVKEMVGNIEKSGTDKFDINQLSINFNKKTSEDDNFAYFTLRNAGFKKIPVYVDDNTYKIGKALNLFE